MRHVVQFLQGYLREHWDILRHAPIKDLALGALSLLEKWGVEGQGSREREDIRKEKTNGGVRMRRGA